MSFSAIKIKAFIPLGVLVSLVVFYALSNVTWFTNNSVPPYNDCAHHLTNYRTILHSLDGTLSPQQQAYYKKGFLYGPAYYYFSALVSLLFGDTDLISIPVNLFFFVILLIAVYATGKKLFGEREGITACLLLSLYPYIYGSTRIFLLEISVCSLAALCVCVLLYSEELRKTRYTLAVAAVCLWGILTKKSFPIYVVGPLLFVLGKALMRRDSFWKIFFILCIGIILPVILSFNPGTVELFGMHFLRDAPFFSPRDPWARTFYYFLLLSDQMNIPSLLVFITGFVAYLCTKTRDRMFVLAWLLAPLIILTLDPLKSSKYSLPLLPVMALISSWGLHAMVKRPAIRYAILGAVLSFGIFVHNALLWNMLLPVNPLTGKRFWLSLEPYVEYVHKPKNKSLDKVQTKLFAVLRGHIVPGALRHVGVAGHDRNPQSLINLSNGPFTDNHIVSNEWGMKSYILRYHLPLVIQPLRKIPDYKIPQEISELDLIVAGAPVETFYPRAVPFFDLVATLDVPSDGSKIYIYAKNKSIDQIQGKLFEVLMAHAVPGRGNQVGITVYPKKLPDPVRFQFTDNFIILNRWGMKSYVLQHRLPFAVHPLRQIPRYYGPEGISGCDFLVTALPLMEFSPYGDFFFERVAILDTPSDGSKIYLYARKKGRERSTVFESRWVREAAADPRVQQAQAAFRGNRYEDSIKLLREFVEDKETSGHVRAVASIGLGSSYVQVMVRDAAVSGDCFLKAEQYFNEALKIMDVSDPMCIAAYSGLGYLYLSKRSYDRALSYLSRGLGYFPREGYLKEHGDLLTNMGYCYLGMKDPVKARGYFAQAIAVFSDANHEMLKNALTGLEFCIAELDARKNRGESS